MKDNKGITLITLIISVIVIVIIAAVVINVSTNLTQTAKVENIETYMISIKSKCKVLSTKYAIGEIGEKELYGTEQKDQDKDYYGWYKLSQADLYDIGVRDANAEDGYYVNYKHREGEEDEEVDVAYAKGIMINAQEYHYLSEILNKKNK